MAEELLTRIMARAPGTHVELVNVARPTVLASGVNMTLHRLRNRKNRAELARVPERPTPVSLIRAQLEAARAAGVTADELDARHVLLSYDARDREQWLAVDQLQDATYSRSTTEGDRSFESSPNNWIVIHFDYGACAGEWPPTGFAPPTRPR